MRNRFLTCVLFIVALPGATALSAQSVQGRVVAADEDTVGLEAAEVTLLADDGVVLKRVLTGPSGEFRISAPRAGAYRLAAERLGYRRLDTDPLELVPGQVVEVALKLAPEAVELEPLTVVRRREVERYTLDEFYDRVERMKESSRGAFITREDMDRSGARRVSEMLRHVWGVRVRPVGRLRRNAVYMASGSQACLPAIYVDGVPFRLPPDSGLDDVIDLHALEGIEVYRGWTEAPDHYVDVAGCGMILLWRRAPDGEHGWTWKRTLGAAILSGVLFLLLPALAN